jgi:serine protease Do
MYFRGKTNYHGCTGAQQIEVPATVAGLEELLETIYDVVNPSIVSIEVFYDISDIFPSPEGESPQYLASLGSGFIWDIQGYIVTNNHVIEGAERISVTFNDGTIVEAALVGADPDSDLAVIRVNTDAIKLRPVALGDSTELKVG